MCIRDSHRAPPTITTIIETRALTFTLLATTLGTIKLLSMNCTNIYAINTQSASIGSPVAIATNIGIAIATNPPMYGITFKSAPISPINMAYCIPMINKQREFKIATISA